MKKMKKVILVVWLLIALCLSGCGKSSGGNSIVNLDQGGVIDIK